MSDGAILARLLALFVAIYGLVALVFYYANRSTLPTGQKRLVKTVAIAAPPLLWLVTALM